MDSGLEFMDGGHLDMEDDILEGCVLNKTGL